MHRSNIFAIVNQKGGVGKTTTAINLATALAATQKKVLLVDFDPQGNTSSGLGVLTSAHHKGSYAILLDPHYTKEACLPTQIPYLNLISATPDLSGAEIELVSLKRREMRLKEALSLVQHLYDYIFIDCPPSLGLLTLNALVSASQVLVPLQCEFYALEGLSHLLSTMQKVKKIFNPTLDLRGVILTMYDRRSLLNQQVAADAKQHLKGKVYNTLIPRNVRIAEASSFGKPVILYDVRCLGTLAYLELAKEFIQQEIQSV